MLADVFRKLLALGLCYRVGGPSIRQIETLNVLTYVHSSYFL